MNKRALGLVTLILLISSFTYATNDSKTSDSSQAIDQLLTIEDQNPEIQLGDRQPILLIHGWNFNGKPAPPISESLERLNNFILADSFLKNKYKTYFVRYWSNSVEIPNLSTALREQMEANGLHEKNILIIGHSMGGLIARSYMNEQNFATGKYKDEKCGTNVDLLITLGTPHHGTPISNGPVRTTHFDIATQLYIGYIESFVFGETTYNEVNRVDLHWDNYDDLLDYQHFAYESNPWLVQLNETESFNSKIIAYSANIEGDFEITTQGGFKLGAWLIDEGWKMESDGIVPVVSAQFDGKLLQGVRHFEDYTHTEIAKDKPGFTFLFDSIRIDLLNSNDLKLVWPSATNTFIKAGTNYSIEWFAPPMIEQINVLLSTNGGTSYQSIKANINAQTKKHMWSVPSINSSNCLIKIEDSKNDTILAISQNEFTIYNNQLNITNPISPNYFVRNQDNTIKWDYQGIPADVQITYIDSVLKTEHVLANKYANKTGSNSFLWEANTSFTPSNQAFIKIELIDLESRYGISDLYSKVSSPFRLLGEPSFEFNTTDTPPSDYFGVKGEELVIGKIFDINWTTEGEIKFAAIYLCDSLRNKIKLISGINLTPSSKSENTTSFRVPELYGDKFCFYAMAGRSLNSIQIETYTENTFRINQKVKINWPQNGDSTVSIQPCYQLSLADSAIGYSLYIHDTLTSDQYPAWNYNLNDSMFCTPAELENELQPGMTYQAVAVAHFNNFNSFADKIIFTTNKTSPWEFALISPEQQDTTQEDSIEITWTRSVGASQYKVEFHQNNNIIYEEEVYNPTDTSIVVSLTNDEYHADILVLVKAINAFGETTITSSFYKKWKTDIDLYHSKNPIKVLNYPNPFSNQTTFEFSQSLHFDAKQASLTIYNMEGQKIEEHTNLTINSSSNKIVWNNCKHLKGNFIYRLQFGSYSTSGKLEIIE